MDGRKYINEDSDITISEDRNTVTIINIVVMEVNTLTFFI